MRLGLYFWRPPLPCKAEFRRIRRTKYIPNVNDCSNKAAAYADALMVAGYNPSFVVVALRGQRHAVVAASGVFYDPTFGWWGNKCPGDYRFTVRYVDRGKWGNEFAKYRKD